jgi:hypothetical protein
MYSPGRNFVFTIALMQSSRFAAKDGRLRVLVVAAILVPWLVIGCSAQNPPISEQTVAESRAAGAAAVKLATDFEWVASPADDLASAGAHTVRLPRCPAGVFGNEPEYWVYIAGSGAAEAAKVTGGSCKGDGQAGTLTFTSAHAHAAGYRISSASSGLQEASIAARWSNQTAPKYHEGGKVVAPPGEFKVFAPVSFSTRNQTIDFSGSMFECWVTDDACLKVGLASNYNATLNVTLENPRGRPTQAHGRQPMIAVYGQKTRILNLMSMAGVEISKGVSGTFGTYLSVIGDQAFLLDGLDSTAGWGLECTRAFCGTLITAPGPFGHPSNSAVGWIKHAQISLQCMGNGIDWQSGNTLRVSDTVLQGYSQFGLRSGNARGGYGPTMMENVYMEDSGVCPNPIGNVGAAGVIMQGNKLSFRGGEGPAGHVPQFAKSGSTRYEYFVVAHSAKFGASNPLYAGFALSSGSGSIEVTIADIAGASSFDLLRVPSHGGRADAPSGAGDYLVEGNLARATACSKGICTFNDSQKALASYTVAPPNYFPKLDYWPGSLVLAAAGDSESVLGTATAVLSELNNYFLIETNTAGSTAPVIFSEQCLAAQGSPLWMSCFTAALPPSVLYDQNALVLASKPNNDGGLKPNLKGRINLSTSGSGPSHFITLVDSNFAKTVASSTNRPANDNNDTYIGYDQGSGSPSSVGLSFGAPQSISNYVGSVGDNKNWKERLTAKDKAFAVPVVIEEGNSLTVGGGTPISKMKVYTASAVPSISVPAQSCADAKSAVAGLAANEQVLGVTPPKALGNLAVNAYAGAANSVTLHFCNPSTGAINSPSGAYTFLGVR